jgi:hypothetical protein
MLQTLNNVSKKTRLFETSEFSKCKVAIFPMKHRCIG